MCEFEDRPSVNFSNDLTKRQLGFLLKLKWEKTNFQFSSLCDLLLSDQAKNDMNKTNNRHKYREKTSRKGERDERNSENHVL